MSTRFSNVLSGFRSQSFTFLTLNVGPLERGTPPNDIICQVVLLLESLHYRVQCVTQTFRKSLS